MLKKLIFLSILIITLAACETTSDKNLGPKEAFAEAKEFYDDEDWLNATSKLQEFAATHPYSKYAIEAELLIANVHFENGEYAEAGVAYAQFVKLHPKHSQVDLAMFRVGETYWKKAPESIDREQDYTAKALEEWREFIRLQPDSKYVAKAKTYIKEGTERIAQSEEFIAKFYCKQKLWAACAYRNILLTQSFPEFKKLKVDAQLRAAEALLKLAREKKDDPKKDTNLYFRDLTASEIIEKAKKLKNLAASNLN